VDGAICLNPGPDCLVGGVTADTVLFVLAKDSGRCDAVAKDGCADVSTWLDTFKEKR